MKLAVAICFSLVAYCASSTIWEALENKLVSRSKQILDYGSSVRDIYFAAKFRSNRGMSYDLSCSRLQDLRQLCSSSLDGYFLKQLQGLSSCSDLDFKSLKLSDDFSSNLSSEFMNYIHAERENTHPWLENFRNYLADSELLLTKTLSYDFSNILSFAVENKDSPLVTVVMDDIFASRKKLLEAQPNLLLYLYELFPSERTDFPDYLRDNAENLVSLAFHADFQISFESYQSLAILRQNLLEPLILQTENFEYKNVDTPLLSLMVFDAVGQNLEISSGRCVSVKRAGKDSTLSENIDFGGNAVKVTNPLLPGRYFASFEVDLIGIKKGLRKFQSAFLIQKSLLINSVRAGISYSNKPDDMELRLLESQNSLKETLGSSQVLSIVVSFEPVTGRKLHQIGLKLCSMDEGSCVLFLNSKCRESGEGDCSIKLSLDDHMDQFNYISGLYAVSLIFGDISLAEPIEWSLGSLLIKLPSKPVLSLPLYAKALLYTSDTTLQVLPEIEHQMRAPARRASIALSTAFALLIVLPLISLLAFLLSLHSNMRRLRSSSSVLSVVLFASLLVSYCTYWFGVEGMSFYSTIKYLTISFPAIIFVSRQALISLIAQNDEE